MVQVSEPVGRSAAGQAMGFPVNNVGLFMQGTNRAPERINV